MSGKVLGPQFIAWLESRKLDPETAARLGCYSGRCVYGRDEQGRQYVEFVKPDATGPIMVFPITEYDNVVSEKYRGPDKFFFQKPNGKRTFINGDVLDDPGLISGQYPLVIVEGEPDLLTAIDAGYPLTVSVPDGAPNPPKGHATKHGEALAIDLSIDDAAGKFEFMWINRDRLKKVRRYVIAVDNDRNGQYLAEELVRRLGASRCSFVTYPDGCKDLNDVLMRDGMDAVKAVLAGAREYPIKGLYRLSDYPDRPPIKTYSTGWARLDDHYKPFFPSLTVWTGLPGSGKSTMLLNLFINLCSQHGWRAVVFSPEMPTVPQMRDKLRRVVMGARIADMSEEYLRRADAWIDEHFCFVDFDVVDDHDDDLTLEWVCERVIDAVLRHGVRLVGLDPWNEMEHNRRRGETGAEYQNRALRMLRRTAVRYGLQIHVVAHPTKDVAEGAKVRTPHGYDIDGSAAWVNKPDHLVIVDADPGRPFVTNVHIRKVRWDDTGEKGRVDMLFLPDSGRYALLDGSESQVVTS